MKYSLKKKPCSLSINNNKVPTAPKNWAACLIIQDISAMQGLEEIIKKIETSILALP